MMGSLVLGAIIGASLASGATAVAMRSKKPASVPRPESFAKCMLDEMRHQPAGPSYGFARQHCEAMFTVQLSAGPPGASAYVAKDWDDYARKVTEDVEETLRKEPGEGVASNGLTSSRK